MITLYSYRCHDCRRPWCSTEIDKTCPFCGRLVITVVDERLEF